MKWLAGASPVLTAIICSSFVHLQSRERHDNVQSGLRKSQNDPKPCRSRLGLWGPGSAFNDFQAFLDSMKKRGVSFLEMLAMEMKSQGYYVARGLSFR